MRLVKWLAKNTQKQNSNDGHPWGFSPGWRHRSESWRQWRSRHWFASEWPAYYESVRQQWGKPLNSEKREPGNMGRHGAAADELVF